MNMDRCQRAWHLPLLLCILALNFASATPIDASPDTDAPSKAGVNTTEEAAKFAVITEDVIPDVENTTQKVIRVNPLDLPALTEDRSGSMDSSLYNIQSILPANRNYVNSNRMRGTKPRVKNSIMNTNAYPPVIRQLIEPKFRKTLHNQMKQLHFLYNQNAFDQQKLSKTMRVHVAPGAYPVYYALSKTNGRFGKFPIKGFRTPTEFLKYLAKNKVASLDNAQRLES
ncbi:uncharacterized protein LOC129244532 [Anastrepha obliqua]|uniref:uncharacterized protein LOC129244532 n=1 Tax=Anastrepha obliqua TaxID=95512 RepID=UPI002409FB7B|nr:uncharacterized protein LOC129244532 [Anastrepha obliqua]